MVDCRCHCHETCVKMAPVFRAAEARAEGLQSIVDDPVNAELGAPAKSRQILLAVAQREMKARRIRTRLLPTMIFSDVGWLALLDLFLAGPLPDSRRMSACASRWCVSQDTARRHAVALIATGLIRRVLTGECENDFYLVLTQSGQHRVTQTLAALAE